MRCVDVGSSVLTNVPLWRGILVMEEAGHTWGQDGYGKSLHLPFSFVVILKLLWKKKKEVLIKKIEYALYRIWNVLHETLNNGFL